MHVRSLGLGEEREVVFLQSTYSVAHTHKNCGVTQYLLKQNKASVVLTCMSSTSEISLFLESKNIPMTKEKTWNCKFWEFAKALGILRK